MKYLKDDNLLLEVYQGKHQEWEAIEAREGFLDMLMRLDEQLQTKGMELERLETWNSCYIVRVVSRE